MGTGQSRQVPVPSKGTPAYYIYIHYSPKACKYLDKWNWYTRDDPVKQFPQEGTFDRDKIVHLKGALKSRGSKIPQTLWDALFYWYDEMYKRRTESQTRSLKDSQEKLKQQLKAVKEKLATPLNCTPATAPMYPALPRTPPPPEPAEDILDFCSNPALLRLPSQQQQVQHQAAAQVQEALPQPLDVPSHNLEPGDWVYVKVHQRKNVLQPRWKGPFQMLLTTNTAVRCPGHQTWTHASHCKKVSPPLDPEVVEFQPKLRPFPEAKDKDPQDLTQASEEHWSASASNLSPEPNTSAQPSLQIREHRYHL
ncbi:PREDICTED: uncharacterized protein LOC109316660 [Crocodylus porosus]|uniref:uncharacterized protein LOC109316660 n=1 Tax=Crocodylus porosus TaxID=8502 RepID=UPI00093DC6E8|nr:PREDICTED: uncharacterized protein LOC109316660 [Crocodylus porosus]